jgi:predicted transglutaminase-like cysteine proteinase
MKDWKLKPAITLALLASSLGARASASAAPGPAGVSYAPVGGPGWADFCPRYAGECDGGPLAPLDVNLIPQAMKEIERVDRVNAHVKPVSDMDRQWDYPADGKGDCEDYALFKLKILMNEGFPRQTLLMTVVKDDRNAVLTVKTNAGDFVPDE